MYQTIKNAALSFHQSFRSSATIVVARANVAVGAALSALLAVDPQMLGNLIPQLKDPRYLAAWIVVNGFITEYARRRPGSRGPLAPVDPCEPTLDPLK